MMYVSDSTESSLSSLRKSMPHAVLLTGQSGVGLQTIAHALAEQTGILADIIAPESTKTSSVASIGVDRIRGLYEFTKAKQSRLHIVIIDDADRMNHVAQNALLKLLEEPSSSTCFILTSHRPEQLLPTIRSRVRSVRVTPVSQAQSLEQLSELGIDDPVKLQQLLYVASGLPAELARLSTDDSVFETLKLSVQRARSFMQGSRYDQLAVIHGLKDNRSDALTFIELTLRLLHKLAKNDVSQTHLARIERLMDAYDSIERNGNVRLQLARAVLY